MAVASLIFPLTRRSKVQNAGPALGYLDNILTPWSHFRRKPSPRPQDFVSF